LLPRDGKEKAYSVREWRIFKITRDLGLGVTENFQRFIISEDRHPDLYLKTVIYEPVEIWENGIYSDSFLHR
jgi:hypothetical protein